uniref:Crumbs homolog 3a n=1 Tax=Xiphophorus couchianus TaxID=32473 RepID=A0A3B5LU57_9TELE
SLSVLLTLTGYFLSFRPFSGKLRPNIAVIVAPTVTLGVLAIVLGVLGWLFFVVKKKRQTEGTYRPSAEENSGPCSVAAPDALQLPKEERLI